MQNSTTKTKHKLIPRNLKYSPLTSTLQAMHLYGKSLRWLFQQSTELAMRVTPRKGHKRPLIHSVVSLSYSSIRQRSSAGHSGVSATLIAAGIRSLCQRLKVGPVGARRVLRGYPIAPSLSGTHAAWGEAKQKAR